MPAGVCSAAGQNQDLYGKNMQSSGKSLRSFAGEKTTLDTGGRTTDKFQRPYALVSATFTFCLQSFAFF